MKFDDLTDYDKGIFWAIGSYVDNRFVFRHKNLYFIENTIDNLQNVEYNTSIL